MIVIFMKILKFLEFLIDVRCFAGKINQGYSLFPYCMVILLSKFCFGLQIDL